MVRAVIAGCLAASLAGEAALGGAWTQPEDTLLVIVSTGRNMAPFGAFVGETADEDSNTAQIFAEWGAWNDLTVGMTVYGEVSTTLDEIEARIGGHVRKNIWTGEAGDVVSIQAGASFPVERWFGNGLGDDRPDSVTELDLRVLYGRGWQWDWGDSFVSGEFGLRIRSEGQDEEIRTDITVGHTPIDGLLGLFSVYGTFPIEQGGFSALKIAPSIAWTFRPLLGPNDKKPHGPINANTIQLGFVWDAMEPDDGLTLGLSVWKRF